VSEIKREISSGRILPVFLLARPNSRGEEEEEEEEATHSRGIVDFNLTSLQQDAAGLKLFLDILNGPDNPEAEAELRYVAGGGLKKIELLSGLVISWAGRLPSTSDYVV